MSTEVVVKEAESPVLVTQEKDRPGRTVYSWKHGKTMFLSAKESLLAEEFLVSRSYASCVRKLKAEMGYEISPVTVARWLRRGHIQGWLGEQMEERGISSGWTREHWLAVMTAHLMGTKRLANGDLYAMKLIGDHKGWKEVGDTNMAVQINFTERAA